MLETACSNLFSVAVIKLWTKSTHRWKQFILAYILYIVYHLGKARQEIEGRTWSRDHRWMLITGLVSYLTQPRTLCPRMTPLTVVWPLPHQSSIRLVSNPGWWRQFLNWGFHLSRLYLVCVTLKKASLHIASNGDVMNLDRFRVNKTSVGHGNLVRLLKLVNVSRQHAQLELSFPLLPEP